MLLSLSTDWRDLHQTSVQSLRSDEDEQRSSPIKPFYLEPETPPQQHRSPIHENHFLLDQRSESPVVEVESETNKLKTKWEIRLPELLDSMVGPDRQVKMRTILVLLFLQLSLLET